MLEEGFAAAARLNTMGFPVGVQLASRLVPDVSHFLTTYVDSVSQMLMISQAFSVNILHSNAFTISIRFLC